MANLNVNKVIYGGDVLIDLTGDTVSADKILKGITAHDKSGAKITGECTYDSDTSDDTAAVAEILAGKTAHARGSKLTGTMKIMVLSKELFQPLPGNIQYRRDIMMVLVRLPLTQLSRRNLLPPIFERELRFLA